MTGSHAPGMRNSGGRAATAERAPMLGRQVRRAAGHASGVPSPAARAVDRRPAVLLHADRRPRGLGEDAAGRFVAGRGRSRPGRGVGLARPCRGRRAGPVDGGRDRDRPGRRRPGGRGPPARRHRRRCGDRAGTGRRGPGRRRHAGRPGPGQSARDHLARRPREPAAAGAAPTATGCGSWPRHAGIRRGRWTGSASPG